MIARIGRYAWLPVLLLFFLTSCWDERNIEEHGFILGSAVDVAEEEIDDQQAISLTNQFIVPSGFGVPAAGSGNEQAHRNITSDGLSLNAITGDMRTMTSKVPIYNHLDLVVLSEDIAKKPNQIASLLDMYIRDLDVRRAVYILIAEGKARDILDIDVMQEQTPTEFIQKAVENNEMNVETIEAVPIGDVHSYLLDDTSYVLPRISYSSGKLQMEEGAVFRGDNTMVGSLDADETKGYNLATRQNESGLLNISIRGEMMTFKVEYSSKKMNIDARDPENVHATISIKAEGFIEEMSGSNSLMQKKYLTEIEDTIAKKIKKLVEGTVQKAKQELHADILGVDKTLRQYHYDQWQKVKDNWDQGDENHFRNTTFDIKSDVTVRDFGTTNRTKDKQEDKK